MSDQTTEKLLAQGRYDYFFNGELQAIEERWQLSRTGDRLWLRSERHVPAVDVVLRVFAEIALGDIRRCLLHWEREGERISTALFVRGQRAHRYYHRPPISPGGLPRPAFARCHSRREPVFFPLLRVFAGATLGRIHALTTDPALGAEVLIPWIIDPRQEAQLLAPSTAVRRVHARDTPLPARPDGVAIPVPDAGLQCLQYSGEQYGEDTRFWVADGLLRAYCWNQHGGSWLVSLAGLSGRWPRQLFSSPAGLADTATSCVP